MNNILLIEDDPVLGRSLSIKLDLDGYKTFWVQTLHDATQSLLNDKFEMLLVDVGLPDGNGIDFLKKVRETSTTLPVIVFTARSDEDAAVESINGGANDFLRKPFGSRELAARMKKVLHEPLSLEPHLKIADVVIFLNRRKLLYKDVEIDLNRREFEIFKFLAQNLNNVVSREMLISAMGSDSNIIDRTVDSHVSHIRAKLKEKKVESVKITPVYGIGYRLEKAW